MITTHLNRNAMQRMTLLFFLLVLARTAGAQEANKMISGEVKDAQHGPLAGATVSLLRADSTLIRGIASDAGGRFAFKNLDNGTFRIAVTSIGNQKYVSLPVVIDAHHAHVAFPVIVLVPATTTLGEVVAVAKRPLLVQDIDKTTVHVDALVGSAGSNTLEVLEKTPGVTVGTDGAISLNGQGEVLVLIDNRPTYLSRQDLALYLKSLPGGSLDKIELMTNPPARYDAAGSAIINIRLKKSRLQGLTGNLAAGYNQGVTSRSNNALHVNYKRGKVNGLGNLSYYKDGNYARDFYDRRFFDESNTLTSSAELRSHYTYVSRGIAARLGLDYAASPRTVYGLSMHFQDRPRQDQLEYTSLGYGARAGLDSVGRGTVHGTHSWSNAGVNFNYQHKPKAGREITADLNYLRYQARGRQDLQHATTLADGTPGAANAFLYLLPSAIAIYTARTDYQHALKHEAKLEAGLKSSVVVNDNRSDHYDVNETANTPDYGKSNHFRYRETIHAAYVNARKDWKRVAVQAGLRAEHTLAQGRQLGNAAVAGSAFGKHYTGVFPTVQFRFKLDSTGKHGLNLSLARRINRANYHQLNPFRFYRDNYSYTSGNPDLGPQYNYIAEVKYQHGPSLNVGVRYGQFTGMIFSTTRAVDNLFITRPENLARGRNIALTTNLSVAPAKWWNLNANLVFAHLALASGIYTESLHARANVARASVVNGFTLGNGWSGELSGFYGSRDLAGQTVIGGRYRANAAVQKEVLGGKGTVRLVFEDIFHSWQQRDRTLGLRQADAYHTNETDTRRVGAAFTYRFGKESFGRKRKHNDNAADEEKGRAE
jgi:hypothetical protein